MLLNLAGLALANSLGQKTCSVVSLGVVENKESPKELSKLGKFNDLWFH